MHKHRVIALLTSCLILSGISAPAFSATDEDISVNRWVKKVESRIDRLMTYPAHAASNQQQGLVRMRVELDPTGTIMSANIVDSSGYEYLDKAALKLAKHLDELPTPPMINGERVTAVRFHLLYTLSAYTGRLTARDQMLRHKLGHTEIKDIQANSKNRRVAMVLETANTKSENE